MDKRISVWLIRSTNSSTASSPPVLEPRVSIDMFRLFISGSKLDQPASRFQIGKRVEKLFPNGVRCFHTHNEPCENARQSMDVVGHWRRGGCSCFGCAQWNVLCRTVDKYNIIWWHVVCTSFFSKLPWQSRASEKTECDIIVNLRYSEFVILVAR